MQLNNYKHNFRNSRRVCHIHFVQLKQETRNPSKNVAYFIISDLFQDIVQIKNSCFWKMIANCASVGLTSFSSDKFTPICLVLHTDYPPRYRERDCQYIRSIFWSSYFCENFLSVSHRRFNQSCKDYSLKIKKKKKKKKRKRNLWIDLKKFKVLLRRNSRKLGFLCDYIIGVFSPNVPKNMFVMLLSEPHSTDPSYKAIKVNVMESCVSKSLSLICLWTPIELKLLKNQSVSI